MAGANRYRNLDEDLPSDFDAQRAARYQALNLPLEAGTFIDGLRGEMRAALAQLDHDWAALAGEALFREQAQALNSAAWRSSRSIASGAARRSGPGT